jgi:hypothetical protein
MLNPCYFYSLFGALSTALHMINVSPIMSLSKRDNTKPSFTPATATDPQKSLRAKMSDPSIPKSIILDGFHPRDFRELNLIYCCEQCSYFNTETVKCAMGFKVEKHMRENQLALYNLTGKMALCRTQEVD